ncbi:hypothetical protein G5I_05523 [Acromyrmex echinatior]|uniref:Uncharacterized protein n=1 Tax=Acromyrmex echinatior TaxID=103372 RepID=F4WIJ9_ACREC|nr:hypothetical protein G5I_05523 [Acromyrmex echinatior]
MLDAKVTPVGYSVLGRSKTTVKGQLRLRQGFSASGKPRQDAYILSGSLQGSLPAEDSAALPPAVTVLARDRISTGAEDGHSRAA